MPSIVEYGISHWRNHLAYILVAGMVSVVKNLCSCFFGFGLQIVGQVALTCTCFAQFEGLDIPLDDAIKIRHFHRPVKITVRLIVVGGDLNSFRCEIFYYTQKVCNVFEPELVLEVISVPIIVFKPMVDAVSWPKVNQHYSVRLELLNPVDEEIVVVFKRRQRGSLE